MSNEKKWPRFFSENETWLNTLSKWGLGIARELKGGQKKSKLVFAISHKNDTDFSGNRSGQIVKIVFCHFTENVGGKRYRSGFFSWKKKAMAEPGWPSHQNVFRIRILLIDHMSNTSSQIGIANAFCWVYRLKVNVAVFVAVVWSFNVTSSSYNS